MKKRLCVVVTVSSNLWSLYRGQFQYLKTQGFEVTAVASEGSEHDELRATGINTKCLSMKKEPSPFFDFISLIKFIIFFTFNRFDIVSVSTPKASLLASLGAFLTFQKRIVFTVRGRAYENKTGLSRRLYERIDWLICKMSSEVLCISKEILDDMVKTGVCPAHKISILGSGSSNGVDLSRFTRLPSLVAQGQDIRDSLHLSPSDVLILYSGRIRRDKGTTELVTAFSEVAEECKTVHLLIQGEFDSIDKLPSETLETIRSHRKIHLRDWCQDVEKYFAAADIFCFPSHREGFGNVALEASAMELPVVAFDVIGCRESVQHMKTGFLVEKLNVSKLKSRLLELIGNPTLRKEMGIAGRHRIENCFDSKLVWQEIANFYKGR